jgi:RNA polymerase sigma-70 factor (ECF subfamily)
MYTGFTQGTTLAALTGEESAYETLIQCFEHPVFNIVGRLLDDPSDAAQVTQKVFRKAFRNVGAFRGDRTLKLWIYRIAVSEAGNHRRWFSRRRQVGSDGEPGEPFSAMIEEALKTMDPRLRAALVLREIEGLSYDEISEVLDVSPDTVKSRIMRGRDALRKSLAGRVNSEGDWRVPIAVWRVWPRRRRGR